MLEAELLEDDKPVPGFSRTDCVPFRGDEKSALMRWKGGEKCPAENVRLRVYLNRARLYSLDWTAE